MFTGIIEANGRVKQVVHDQTNRHFQIESAISSELQVDQSVAHNGVCLTVTKVEGTTHWVTAIDETLQKSNLGAWHPEATVNLERCMKADGRFDGHIVQGHVDQTATVKSIANMQGSFLVAVELPNETKLLVEKGSICVNGVSLTCFNVLPRSFQVAIIPYTWQHTTFGTLKIGEIVNLEFDIVGKYVQRLMGELPTTT